MAYSKKSVMEVKSIRSRTVHLTEIPYPFLKLPMERLAEMNDLLHDSSTISIYSDYSSIFDSNIVGLAGCFVGDSNTYVESRKQYLDFKNDTIYGEMLAVSFCLGILPTILNDYHRLLQRPQRVVIYSDMKVIVNVRDETITFKKQHHNDVASEVRMLLTKFRNAFPLMNITVEFLGRERKTSNIYYKAAHNAARRIIGK